jgi:ABC-type molybdate transport system ATPase subunit
MKVKPKEIMVNLPVVLLMDSEDEVGQFASNVNTIIHGKVKLKTDILGLLGEKIVAIFYLQRNNEYQDLREEFRVMIEQDEIRHLKATVQIGEPLQFKGDFDLDEDE